MLKKISLATVSSILLLLAAAAQAEPVSIVFSCELREGSTREDVMEINARWLKWARETGGGVFFSLAAFLTDAGDLYAFSLALRLA